MSEAEVPVVEEEVEEKGGAKEPNPFLDTARKVLLASIGAVALAQEEVEEFVNRLVERGELAEKDGRKLIKDVMERRKEKAREARREIRDDFDERIEEMLKRMNVPTKSDIEALSRKVNGLSKKVDELKKSQ